MHRASREQKHRHDRRDYSSGGRASRGRNQGKGSGGPPRPGQRGDAAASEQEGSGRDSQGTEAARQGHTGRQNDRRAEARADLAVMASLKNTSEDRIVRLLRTRFGGQSGSLKK